MRFLVVFCVLVGASLVLAAPRPPLPIKNVVTLMLENRAFDHMCGFLKGVNPEINGLTGRETTPIDPSQPNGQLLTVGNTAPYIAVIDPDHSVNSTTFKIFGGFSLVSPAPMNGFVAWEMGLNNNSVPLASDAFNAFTPSRVPIISTLAQQFALFDAFYPSVPGPTFPNRMYALTATSHGAYTNNPPPGGWPQETFFEKLEQVGKEWNIFYHDASWALILSRLRTAERMARIQPFEYFFKAAADGTLADYTWLEPRTAIDPWTMEPASDQHPDHDVRAGELLMKQVYEALRNGPLWNQTLLIITYDEHGGYWDHVPTPLSGVPNPDGIPPQVPQAAFNFDRLGVRVPLLLVSPWINKGVVEHDPVGPTQNSKYDTSSIPGTLHHIFGTKSYLTKRDEWAGKWDHLLRVRTEPRTDCPTKLPNIPPPDPAAVKAEAQRLVNALQCDLLRTLEDSHGDCSITQLEAGRYLKHLTQHNIAKYKKRSLE